MEKFDHTVSAFLQKAFLPIARIALFVVFFWFGFLKIIDASPANPLVEDLLFQTLPFVNFDGFSVFLGLWEMLIGIAFIVEGWEWLALILLAPHMVTTFLPLTLLSDITWKGFLMPTIEGQYIIKNIVIIALAVGVLSRK